MTYSKKLKVIRSLAQNQGRELWYLRSAFTDTPAVSTVPAVCGLPGFLFGWPLAEGRGPVRSFAPRRRRARKDPPASLRPEHFPCVPPSTRVALPAKGPSADGSLSEYSAPAQTLFVQCRLPPERHQKEATEHSTPEYVAPKSKRAALKNLRTTCQPRAPRLGCRAHTPLLPVEPLPMLASALLQPAVVNFPCRIFLLRPTFAPHGSALRQLRAGNSERARQELRRAPDR